MNYTRVNVSETHAIRLLINSLNEVINSLSSNNRKPLSYMFSMLITVPSRTSSAISSLQVDGLKKQAYVTFKNGQSYAYGNVSTRAILNVLFNPDVSLGFWVNNHLTQSDRTTTLNGDEFDYESAILNRAQYAQLAKKNEEVKLPAFA